MDYLARPSSDTIAELSWKTSERFHVEEIPFDLSTHFSNYSRLRLWKTSIAAYSYVVVDTGTTKETAASFFSCEFELPSS